MTLEFINTFIQNYGIIALFVLMISNGMLSIPPSELVISIGGALVSASKLSFILVFLSVFLGNLVGAILLYTIGRYFGHEWIIRYINKIHKKRHWMSAILPKEEKIESLIKLFKKDGHYIVLFFRLVPGLRAIVSLPAGFIKMPLQHLLFFQL